MHGRSGIAGAGSVCSQPARGSNAGCLRHSADWPASGCREGLGRDTEWHVFSYGFLSPLCTTQTCVFIFQFSLLSVLLVLYEPSGGQPCGLRPVKRKRTYLVTVFSSHGLSRRRRRRRGAPLRAHLGQDGLVDGLQALCGLLRRHVRQNLPGLGFAWGLATGFGVCPPPCPPARRQAIEKPRNPPRNPSMPAFEAARGSGLHAPSQTLA